MKTIILNSEEVIDVFHQLGISYELLTQSNFSKLIVEFSHQYLKREVEQTNYPYPLWESLKREGLTSFQYEFAWDFYDRILANQEVILFFEPYKEQIAIRLQNGAVISKVLNECSPMVTYITNPSLSFLFCYNDHDFLIVGGEGLDLMKNANVSLEISE